MKKLFLYVVLGLFFCNVVLASDNRNISLALRCHSTGYWLYTLDISKDDNTHGYVSETNTWDGEKKPEFTLVITANEIEYELWKGEVLYIDVHGKREFKLTMIEVWNENLINELHAGIFKNNGDVSIIKLKAYKTAHNKNLYYKLNHIHTRNIKSLKNKKKTFNMMRPSSYFISQSDNYVCFK